MPPPGLGDNERNALFSIGQNRRFGGPTVAGLPQCAEIGEIGSGGAFGPRDRRKASGRSTIPGACRDRWASAFA